MTFLVLFPDRSLERPSDGNEAVPTLGREPRPSSLLWNLVVLRKLAGVNGGWHIKRIKP